MPSHIAKAAINHNPAKAAKAANPDRVADRRRDAAERVGALLQADGLLRLPQVLSLVPVSPSTWWEGIRTGRFPAGVRLSSRCTAWRSADIRALLARLGSEGQA